MVTDEPVPAGAPGSAQAGGAGAVEVEPFLPGELVRRVLVTKPDGGRRVWTVINDDEVYRIADRFGIARDRIRWLDARARLDPDSPTIADPNDVR